MELFSLARSPRLDRLVGQMQTNVFGQFVDRLVALLAILRQRLEADRLKIALERLIDLISLLLLLLHPSLV